MSSEMSVTDHWLNAEYQQAAHDATRDTVHLLHSLGVPGGVLYGLATDYPMYGIARAGASGRAATRSWIASARLRSSRPLRTAR